MPAKVPWRTRRRFAGLRRFGRGARLVGGTAGLLGFACCRIEWGHVRPKPERRQTAQRGGLRTMIGFVASLLAVWCQILLVASISLAPVGVEADPLGSVPICHLDDGTGPAQQAPGAPSHRCALCAICLAHALPSAVLSPPVALPVRQSVTAVRLDAAQPRAPPFRWPASAQPRGPPSLI